MASPNRALRRTFRWRLRKEESPAVIVDLGVCRLLSDWIRDHNIPLDGEDSSLAGMSAEEIGNFYFLLVAICHQTSPRGKPPLQGHINGSVLRGWDYLSAKLEATARTNPEILSPAYWAQITADQVRTMFRDNDLGDRLTDPELRAALIRDLGSQMILQGWPWIGELYKTAQGRIATGPRNIIHLLGRFRAYDDPVHKKSYFFLALMRNSGLWSYSDPENLGAPVDYHEVRGHLRIGTIRVCDSELHRRLLAGDEVTPQQDVMIRGAVHEALMLISHQSGLRNPSQLHYLFWNVFRSCCTRENPHCQSCPNPCALPERYVALALHNRGQRRCPFSGVCQSVNRQPKLLDYQLETDYY